MKRNTNNSAPKEVEISEEELLAEDLLCAREFQPNAERIPAPAPYTVKSALSNWLWHVRANGINREFKWWNLSNKAERKLYSWIDTTPNCAELKQLCKFYDAESSRWAILKNAACDYTKDFMAHPESYVIPSIDEFERVISDSADMPFYIAEYDNQIFELLPVHLQLRTSVALRLIAKPSTKAPEGFETSLVEQKYAQHHLRFTAFKIEEEGMIDKFLKAFFKNI